LAGVLHRDQAYFVRASAARALGHLGKAALPVVPDLQKAAASDDNPVVRRWAAEALQHLQEAP
ncbi:MAG: HEAT repeat domain-containing protein, partial [Planctomycetes bacterium]|nr:HEAT repeat domain-containing protein [Planctomycetota bacterium]